MPALNLLVYTFIEEDRDEDEDDELEDATLGLEDIILASCTLCLSMSLYNRYEAIKKVGS